MNPFPRLQVQPDLPIADRAEEIIAAIQAAQTVVVAGATGSGKSTQLPKLCWLAGQGRERMIGVTQPRRIAARSIAARLASELGCKLGVEVGYKMRFADAVSAATRFKIMTDGTLLAELASDPRLQQYDTIIVDEAHERSLNIDFLLGYLHRLRKARPDLRIVITSATIDTGRIATHFDDAPVIEVEGRTYPVEIQYQELENSGDSQPRLSANVRIAIDSLTRRDARGDILVFLSGEREIHDVARDLARAGIPPDQILPLYSRLPRARQDRIFKPGGGRRVILATNIAETSLTIPGIRFVIDAGTARISRYSHRSKIQRLLIEPISQASANQRAGRCGRTSDGICIRLYDEADFERRPEFTEPELLRSDLAGVVLKMKTLRLGDPLHFPFVDGPPATLVRDGFRTLSELGALDDDEVTPLGVAMARLPVDVRIARMLLEGKALGCVQPVITIAAALSLQDPRERPADRQQAADEAQAVFRHPRSDFMSLLKLWDAYEEARRSRSRKQLREWCERHFLSTPRMREWWELRRQLLRALRHDHEANPAGDEKTVHRALLPALIANVGRREEDQGYVAPRGRRYRLFPGSTLFAKPPPWIMCAFIVETARVYGRTAAPIDAAWIKSAAPHLIRHRYDAPFWSRKQGRVVARRRAALFGIDLPGHDLVGYAGIERRAARQVFIREGLVEGGLRTRGTFQEFNAEQVAKVTDIEARLRTASLLVGPEARYRFFDERIPDAIVTARAFEKWRVSAEREQAGVLHYPIDILMSRPVKDLKTRFPDALPLAGLSVPVSYIYDRTSPRDGATLSIPQHAVAAVDANALEFLIPGWLPDKIAALIRALPKATRRSLHPVKEVARRAEAMLARDRPFYPELARVLEQAGGAAVDAEAWRSIGLPPHLTFNVAIVAADGSTTTEGRDICALRDQLGIKQELAYLSAAPQRYQVDGLTRWEVGDLAAPVELPNGQPGWRALVDQRTTVGVRVFEHRDKANRWHREGVIRLLQLRLKSKARAVRRRPPLDLKTLLYYATVGDREALIEDLLDAASSELVGGDVPRTPELFDALVERARRDWLSVVNELGGLLDQIMAHHHAIVGHLDRQSSRFSDAVADQREQLVHLIYPGFLREVPLPRLRHYPRYLEAAERRCEARALDPSKDAARQRELSAHWQRYVTAEARSGTHPGLSDYHWMLEEWRVSLFAQSLGTNIPVSARRVALAWNETGAMS